jgi:glycosyltransferase involved in cell wall biosynthesis
VKILFLNPTGRMGGAEAALLEVMAGLIERRPSWRLGLIAASDGPLVARARRLGAEVRVVPFPAVLARLGEWSVREDRRSRLALATRCVKAAWPAWRYLARLRSVVQAFGPEIVHTNGLKMHLLGAWSRPPGTPVVWHLHDYLTRRPLSASLLKRYAHACSVVIAPSRGVADQFRALGRNLPPIRTIWNAVDLGRFSPEGDRLDLDDRSDLPACSEGVVRVGLLATFARWKGHHLFLEAIARLPPSVNVRAYVIGGAVYEAGESQVSIDELQTTSARLGLTGRVGFTGFVEDPAPAVRALDILVHASTEPEPFGLAIAEGLACGRAVVTSAGGDAAALVTHGVDALSCTPGDGGALARSIEQLASDPGLRKRLGQAARATAERRFTRRRLASEIGDVYEEIAPDATLRVLHVHSGNLYGGVETFLTTLAREAAVAPRMTSSFALCFEGRLSDELRAHGCQPHLLGAARASRPHTIWRARRSLIRLLARQRVDVVVCHQAWPYAIFGPVIRRAGLPLVFWLHTVSDGQHWLERWARRLIPDLAVANSQFTTGCLERWFPDARVENIYYPLSLQASSAQELLPREDIRGSLDTTHDDLVIVQVGRLESTKGNREALEALATLRDVGGWKYWIVGGPQRTSDERYFSDLKDAARRNGISDRVRFAGERDDVPAVLQAADIYCQPNIRPESFGIALVEAQAAGLPIVTSAIGGAREIVDETCGLLVPPHDIDALATALRCLLADDGLRTRLGRAARDRSGALCDLARQMQRTCEVLSSAVEKQRGTLADASPATLESSAHS